MAHHIIFKYSADHDANISLNEGENAEVIFLDVKRGHQYIDSSLNDLTASVPLSPFRRELVYFAAAVYSADKRILRTKGYDKWKRHFHIYFPVLDIKQWTPVKDIFESAISFLTGDWWEFIFYPTDFRPEIQKRYTHEDVGTIDSVTLLSGGLDSFIGAVDLLENRHNKTVFVSHHPSGNMDHKCQKTAHKFLNTRYPGRVPHIDIFVQPRGYSSTEASSRSRAFLFFVLGITIAGALECPSFIIPENGLISLNVPLTNARIGSLSTRSTHPYFIHQLQGLFAALGLTVSLVTPYQFKTKGEMITESQNIEIVRDGYTHTRSCSTLKYRFKGYPTKLQCGVCFPCIVRRAALHKAGFNSEMYSFMERLDIENIDGKEFPDLWAVKAAAQTYRRTPPTIFDIIGNAPIPHGLDDFLGVYTRGIEELVSFIGM